jgi:methylphosphotriester-DNA--protein-cysteine methyltransferase
LRAIARGGYVRHRVFFRDEVTALAAGFRPSAVCCPQQYRAFRTSKAAQRNVDSSSA